MPFQHTKDNFLYPNEYGVSILIPVRNEEQTIATCIESILTQKFSEKYEIILINDFSTDDTMSILNDYQGRVEVIDLQKKLPLEFAKKSNKKKAIELGVEKAKFNHILLTDGDCEYSSNWLSAMTQYTIKYKKSCVVGPVEYKIKSKNIFFQFLQMDLKAMVGIAGGSIGQEQAIMGNGANILFDKEVFLSLNPYQDNQEIASGDDVFLIQKFQAWQVQSLGFVKNKDAIVTTDPPEDWKTFVNQRIRWGSKAKSYQSFALKLQVFQIVIFYWMLFCLFIASLIAGNHILFAALFVTSFVIKSIIDYSFFSNIQLLYRSKYSWRNGILLECLHIIYVLFIGVLAIFGTYQWKGRKIKT